MPKPSCIEFEDGPVIPILYEDRAVLALDKPAGWMLAPDTWIKTSRNLQLALENSIKAGDYWARARGLKFLRFVHRLDAGTTGVVLFARSPGAVNPYTRLFQSRSVEKRYFAVVQGVPREPVWTCDLPLAPQPRCVGVMQVDRREGQAAETRFRVLQTGEGRALVEARPVTGRTHQIRVHLAAAGHPVIGDDLYPTRSDRGPRGSGADGNAAGKDSREPVRARASRGRPLILLALRAVFLAYPDPFSGRPVRIAAPFETFVREYGFAPESIEGLDWGNRRTSDSSVAR